MQSLTPELHQRYLSMVRRHGSSAVAPLDRGVCTGCHVRQPSRPRQVSEDIYECEHCGRLLYDEDVAYDLSVG